MARYDSEHKTATRHRIVETAARRMKRDGIDASGVATLMADAGLTNGAFYGHFSSKDDLVAHVIKTQLEQQAAALDAMERSADTAETFVRFYLSPEHRDDPADGCPNAALLDELVRGDDATRAAYTRGVRQLLDVVTDHVGDRDTAFGVFTMLVGSLQLARAVSDPALSDDILERGIRSALTLLGER